IIKVAQNEALALTAAAREAIVRERASSDANLAHAARNTVISLRQEITAILHRLLTLDVRKALRPEELVTIVAALINRCPLAQQGSVVVSLSKDDCAYLESSLFGALAEEMKTKIVLKTSDDIDAGFVISFDAGKSHFDFTDKALTEYMSIYLDPKLNQIMRGDLSQPAK
ncbi:MAG: hypothetical protein KKF80_02825, partial [Candidatus Omnitrophica bacterium]|nr:hypothetical protein [Candidatus Omnitrophota bacterium]